MNSFPELNLAQLLHLSLYLIMRVHAYKHRVTQPARPAASHPLPPFNTIAHQYLGLNEDFSYTKCVCVYTYYFMDIKVQSKN